MLWPRSNSAPRLARSTHRLLTLACDFEALADGHSMAPQTSQIVQSRAGYFGQFDGIRGGHRARTNLMICERGGSVSHLTAGYRFGRGRVPVRVENSATVFRSSSRRAREACDACFAPCSVVYSSTLGMPDLILEVGREVATIPALQPRNRPVASSKHASAAPRTTPAARAS